MKIFFVNVFFVIIWLIGRAAFPMNVVVVLPMNFDELLEGSRSSRTQKFGVVAPAATAAPAVHATAAQLLYPEMRHLPILFQHLCPFYEHFGGGFAIHHYVYNQDCIQSNYIFHYEQTLYGHTKYILK